MCCFASILTCPPFLRKGSWSLLLPNISPCHRRGEAKGGWEKSDQKRLKSYKIGFKGWPKQKNVTCPLLPSQFCGTLNISSAFSGWDIVGLLQGKKRPLPKRLGKSLKRGSRPLSAPGSKWLENDNFSRMYFGFGSFSALVQLLLSLFGRRGTPFRFFEFCREAKVLRLCLGCTPRGSCNRTLLRRVLRRFSNSKCFLEGFLEGAAKGCQ